MGDPTNDTISPWQPMSRPIDLKHIGKLLEELGEAVAAVVPYDREKMQDELADVWANARLCQEHFNLTFAPCELPQMRRLEQLQHNLGRTIAAASRCMIQGIDGTEPTTGKLNKAWLEDALTKLLACITAVTAHYRFDTKSMLERTERKKENLRRWHQALD